MDSESESAASEHDGEDDFFATPLAMGNDPPLPPAGTRASIFQLDGSVDNSPGRQNPPALFKRMATFSESLLGTTLTDGSTVRGGGKPARRSSVLGLGMSLLKRSADEPSNELLSPLPRNDNARSSIQGFFTDPMTGELTPSDTPNRTPSRPEELVSETFSFHAETPQGGRPRRDSLHTMHQLDMEANDDGDDDAHEGKKPERRSRRQKAKMNVFDGLISGRATFFRQQLLHEFHLMDTDPLAQNAPKHDTRDLLATPEIFGDKLRQAPHELVKFTLFKRGPEAAVNRDHDRRLDLVRNKVNMPIGVWAHWCVQTSVFNGAVLIMICVSALMLGAQTELDPVAYWKVHIVFDLLDQFILVCFSIEIIVKWLDNFTTFWHDGWNVFDFIVTAFTAIPELMVLIAANRANLGGNDDQQQQGEDPMTQRVASIATRLRVLRTFRTLKMVVRFRSLRLIVNTIITTFQSIVSVLLLLSVLMYIYAVLGIYLLIDYSRSPTLPDLAWKFADIPHALLSLFQLLTLDQWFNIMTEYTTIVSELVGNLFFISWVTIGAFIFRNIFVGAMVRNFETLDIELAKMEQEVKKKKQMEVMLENIMQSNIQSQQVQGLDAVTAAAKGVIPAKGADTSADASPDDIRRIPPELLAGQAKGSLFGRASLKRQSLLFSPRMSLSLGAQSKQAGAEEKGDDLIDSRVIPETAKLPSVAEVLGSRASAKAVFAANPQSLLSPMSHLAIAAHGGDLGVRSIIDSRSRLKSFEEQARKPPGEHHRGSLPSASRSSSLQSSNLSSPRRSPPPGNYKEGRPDFHRNSTVSTVLVDDVSSQGSDRPLLADVEDQSLGGMAVTAAPARLDGVGAPSRPKKAGSVHFDIDSHASALPAQKATAEEAVAAMGAAAATPGSAAGTPAQTPTIRNKSVFGAFLGTRDDEDKSPQRLGAGVLRGLLGGRTSSTVTLTPPLDEAAAATPAGSNGPKAGRGSVASAGGLQSDRSKSIAGMQEMLRESTKHKTGAYYSASERKKIEYLWPKDSLFKYFSIMEKMQDNYKEYQEMQMLAAWTLHELQDT